MKKNIIVQLTTEDQKIKLETSAIYNEEKQELTYIEDDDLKTITKFNYPKKKLCRNNNDLKLIYNFEEGKTTKGTITINDINRSIDINIKTKKIIEENNKIIIDFNVEENSFKYQIEVE